MDVKQIYELVNTATNEAIGETSIVAEDLSNIVDVGNQIFNVDAVDRYVRSLINVIGKVIFVDRKYSGAVPSVYRDEWEYGSVVEKITMDLPDAEITERWELQDGASYDPNLFYKPRVSAKFFNSKTTFTIPMSIATEQVKQSFTSVNALNGFLSMIMTSIENALTLRTDEMVMRTINNFIGETIHDEYGANDPGASSTEKAVNLLYLYNQIVDTPITAAEALYDKEFIRYAVRVMSIYEKRLMRMSTLHNIGGMARFTPAERLTCVMHSDFLASAAVYLYSDTYHDQFVALPKADGIPFWQASGTDYDFDITSEVKIKTADNNSVDISGVIAVMFDRDALGVTNFKRKTTTNYNPRGDFTNMWYMQDCSYFNDYNEQFIVFFIADEASA